MTIFVLFISLSQHILNNLTLIYSAVVLFGMKSEEFTVKVQPTLFCKL